MSKAPFTLSALKTEHDRSVFQSGSEQLDRYLREQATQDVRRRVAACFLALENEKRIIGYYTLASASLPLTSLPPEYRKKLPHYPAVPTVRMGRFAVDKEFQKRGIGKGLLANAINRAMRSEVASYAMVVDAKSNEAASFYQHQGFIGIPDAPLMLFFPFASIK